MLSYPFVPQHGQIGNVVNPSFLVNTTIQAESCIDQLLFYTAASNRSILSVLAHP